MQQLRCSVAEKVSAELEDVRASLKPEVYQRRLLQLREFRANGQTLDEHLKVRCDLVGANCGQLFRQKRFFCHSQSPFSQYVQSGAADTLSMCIGTRHIHIADGVMQIVFGLLMVSPASAGMPCSGFPTWWAQGTSL